MREEFEKLPEISWRLKQSNHRYNAQVGLYEFETDFSNEHYVNGAWYAYQEQQKKIDKALELGYEKRGNVHYLVDEHIDDIHGVLE